MSAAPADLALAHAVVVGDPRAIEQLWALYYSRLYRFCYYQVGGSHEDAQDVLQAVLLAALKSLHSYRGESSLYGWLCGVAWNKAADFRRHEYRVGRVEQRSLKERQREVLTEPDEESRLLDEDRRERARAALSRLPAHYQQVLTLKYLQGRSVEEIMAATGASYKTVESRLTRARQAMREAYEGAACQI